MNTPRDKPHHRPRARLPTRTAFLRQPTHGLPIMVSSPESASFHRQDGRPFRGDPRAPIPTPEVRRGTGCSGHSPGGPQTLPDPQEQVSDTRPSRHPQHRAQSPGGVPVGPRRRGPISLFLTTGRPDASPARLPMALASGPKPSGRRLKASFPHPHRSPSVGARSLSPISARAFPTPRVSAPRPAPAKTSTPHT